MYVFFLDCGIALMIDTSNRGISVCLGDALTRCVSSLACSSFTCIFSLSTLAASDLLASLGDRFGLEGCVILLLGGSLGLCARFRPVLVLALPVPSMERRFASSILRETLLLGLYLSFSV